MTADPSPPPPSQGRLLRDMGIGALIALALAFVAYLILPHRGQRPDDIRTEAAGRLELRVERGPNSGAADSADAPDAALQPGDIVHFRYRNEEPGYLTVLVADTDERVHVHYPQSTESAHWTPNEPEVPRELVLSAPVPKAFAAVLCPRPLPVETVRAAMDPKASPGERFALLTCQIDTHPVATGAQQ